MAIVHLPIVLSPAIPDSPTLPDFDAYPVRGHNAKYATAFETEHLRELYLQGAMAVSQIAHLLEELCAGIYDSDDAADEAAAREPVAHPSDVVGVTEFLSNEKRDQISAWAHGVTPACESTLCLTDIDIIDLEDADTTYLRGACVVGDIADLLEDLIIGLGDKPEDYKTSPPFHSSEKMALAQLSGCDPPSKRADADFEARMSRLSARLAQLETDIKEFSQERNDALKQMELDDAAQDKEHPNSSQDNARRVERRESMVDDLDIHTVLGSEESALIARVWTTTDTATSGFSLVTPAESEFQPLDFGLAFVKDYFLLE